MLSYDIIAPWTRGPGAVVLEYVGEWHSHPAGHDCAPSALDRRLFGWLIDLMSIDGRPALMLIVGEPGTAWFLGRMG